MTQAPDLQELLRVAERAARAAGGVALAGFRGPLDVRSKGGKDIVTQYDTQAEAVALEVIRARYPTHGILAEESGMSGEEAGELFWAVDPIDGTHNYAMQLPFWCSSVAVSEPGGNVLVGAVFDPLHDELFSAVRGGGATLNGATIHVKGQTDLGEASLGYDIGYDPEIASRMLTIALHAQPHVKRLRLMGSAALALTYVAAGRFDAYYHLRLQPWDIAAASLLVQEAGGAITDWEGHALTARQTGAVAANPELHGKVLGLLGRVMRDA